MRASRVPIPISVSVSVLTATVPGREMMLSECKASVEAQTLHPVEHLVELDRDRRGPSRIYNTLAERAVGEWLCPLADDDLLDPGFLEALRPHTAGAEVVYGWCRTPGTLWCPNRLFRKETLRSYNFVPATALIRASLWRQLGGYRDVGMEDWDLWRRALDVGARFVCVPEVVWTYRFHPGNHFNLHHKGASSARSTNGLGGPVRSVSEHHILGWLSGLSSPARGHVTAPPSSTRPTSRRSSNGAGSASTGRRRR